MTASDKPTPDKGRLCRTPGMKTCKVCGVEKPVEAFTARRLTCKACRTKLASEAYKSSPDVREKARARSEQWKRENRERKLAGDRRYSAARNARDKTADPEGFKAAKRAEARRHKERHPDRVRARQAVSDAVKLGRILRPESCEDCGSKGKVEFDHTDGYDQANWLVGRWRCKPCHWKAEHARRAKEEGRG